jgi:hypothetical protein
MLKPDARDVFFDFGLDLVLATPRSVETDDNPVIHSSPR